MYLEYTLNRLNVYHANQGQIWGEKQGGFEIMWGWFGQQWDWVGAIIEM